MDWLWLLVGYLFGSTPTGYLAVKLTRGEDIRDFGSGNIGATNVGRVLGREWAIAVALFDMLKGGVAVGLARLAGVDSALILALVGLFGVLGHNFPVWLRFKGGKGVATSFGVLFFFHPAAAVLGGIVWYVTMRVTRYVSVASMFSLATAPVWLIVVAAPVPFVMVAALLDALTIVRHRPNVVRLLAGTENQVSLCKKVEPPTPEEPLAEEPQDPPVVVAEAVVVEPPRPVEPDEMEDFLPAWSECPETVEYDEEHPADSGEEADESGSEPEAETEAVSEAGEETTSQVLPETEEEPAPEAGETGTATGEEEKPDSPEETVVAASVSSPEEETVAVAEVPEEKPAPRKRRRRKAKTPVKEAAEAPGAGEPEKESDPGESKPKQAAKKGRRRKTVSDEA